MRSYCMSGHSRDSANRFYLSTRTLKAVIRPERSVITTNIV
jgi:hypothetical protein